MAPENFNWRGGGKSRDGGAEAIAIFTDEIFIG